MPDYDLTKLSTRSFEQMIQALASRVIGPGIVVFGDGPDGGREATFRGRLSDFPSAGESWDGYVVVQAKFRQRPEGKPKEDGKWALAQLRKELQDFASEAKKRETPEYYIFATNVVLSAVSSTGGKDTITNALEESQKKIGVKDYRIWDCDQICRFLDADENVRRAYGAWITPGDVLAKLAARIDEKTQDFSKVMANFLQKEILNDHFSKLEQAGHSPEHRVRLEEVFIDLPTLRDRNPGPPEEDDESQPGFLAEMLSVGSTSLRSGDSIYFDSGTPQQRATKKEPGRFVLVGGPGQGKSTLAQFLCQIHRASLLKDRDHLDSEVEVVVNSIVNHCSSEELQLDIARRFPFCLELAHFAKALAARNETGVTSALSYLAFVLKDRTDYDVTVQDLRVWLEDYPWLVVLDGLDEVPASSNRAEVLTAVRNFLVDISSCKGDVLVLATTRPQGYNEEFSPERYRHRWLAPLSIPRALGYGNKLVELSYAHDEQRKEEIQHRLKKASASAATAHLMESPLQVTIMTRLLAQVAQPPQERYSLFQQYYKVIYRREMEREVAVLSQLLRDHEANVDSIHQRTGLLLQMESEKARHTDATITLDEFKTIVTDRLRGEGFEGDDLERLAASIVTGATDRLVFLVPSQSDRVGFEIRSLQEFMAAEALMDGSDKLVVERLRVIAPVSFWENVLLFAAGKCFAERQWLRDSISQVCSELNDDPGDNLAQLAMAGSRMALSLLADGPARRQPAYAQVLARRALLLLELPPEDVHERLASAYEPCFEKVYKEELSRHLQARDSKMRAAAWGVLASLVDKKVGWARDVGERCWSETPKDERCNILMDLWGSPRLISPWMTGKYSQVFFDIPPLIGARLHRDTERIEQLLQGNKLASLYFKLEMSHTVEMTRFFKSEFTPTEFGVMPLAKSRELLAPFKDIKSTNLFWRPLKEGARFADEPSTASLAEALEAVAEGRPSFSDPSRYYTTLELPWPMQACLMAAHNAEELRALASRVRKGEMGQPAGWLEAEARWRSEGVRLQDLTHMNDQQWPISKDIATVGFPFAVRNYSIKTRDFLTGDLATLWARMPGSRAKTIFGELAIERRTFVPAEAELVIDMILSLGTNVYIEYPVLLSLFSATKHHPDAPRAFDHLGRVTRHLYLRGHGDFQGDQLRELVELSTSWLEQQPSYDGLLILLTLIAESDTLSRAPDGLGNWIPSKDPRTSLAAEVLQLTQPNLGRDAMQEIAEKILEKHTSEGALAYRAISIFERHQQNNPVGLAFLETLLGDRPGSSNQFRGHVFGVLLTMLSGREALLSNQETWERLKLPPALFALLSSQKN